MTTESPIVPCAANVTGLVDVWVIDRVWVVGL
jgi:hypothetical protein